MIFACLQVFAVDYASCGEMQDAPGRRSRYAESNTYRKARGRV